MPSSRMNPPLRSLLSGFGGGESVERGYKINMQRHVLQDALPLDMNYVSDRAIMRKGDKTSI